MYVYFVSFRGIVRICYCILYCIVIVAISSVVPLLGDSMSVLMQRQPKELDDILPGCFHRVRINVF